MDTNFSLLPWKGLKAPRNPNKKHHPFHGHVCVVESLVLRYSQSEGILGKGHTLGCHPFLFGGTFNTLFFVLQLCCELVKCLSLPGQSLHRALRNKAKHVSSVGHLTDLR